MLCVQNIVKVHRHGGLKRQAIFTLNADFAIGHPSVVGVIGPNGSGKSSLFDLIAGHDAPTSGAILCNGQNIHQVKRRERARIVRYHRQSQLNCHRRSWFPPDFLLEPAAGDNPAIHLFDEPNEADWMTRLFFYTANELRAKGNVVLFAMHPGKLGDLAMMRDICDRFIFAENGRYTQLDSYHELAAYPAAQQYMQPLHHFG